MICVYETLERRVKDFEGRVLKRAQRLAREAGIGVEGLNTLAHNAMLSFNAGRPWADVDYRKVKTILWLMTYRQWSARKILTKRYAAGQTQFACELARETA